MQRRRDSVAAVAMGTLWEKRIWGFVPSNTITGEGVEAMVGVAAATVMIEAVVAAVALEKKSKMGSRTQV